MNEFWNKNLLAQIHVELSSYCNAACPMCPRYYQGSEIVRPDLELAQISFDQFKEWFKPELVAKLNNFMFCGTVGDPMMAKDVFKIVDYIYENNEKIYMTINTNGGIRKESDWAHLGSISSKFGKRLRVIFSIDGLEDTNHLYRRNVEWATVMRNAKAYIDAGGKAEWDYLIFKHNEHQLQEASELSKNMGFSSFVPKKALGFEYYNGDLVRVAALDKQGDLQYWLEPPEEVDNRNYTKSRVLTDLLPEVNTSIITIYKKEVLDPHTKAVDEYNGKTFLDMPIDFTPSNNKTVKCKSETWGGLREIYVSSTGQVFPCCYIGTMAKTTHNIVDNLQLKKKMEDYGKDYFDLNKYSLEEIIEKNHLNLLYADSWDKQDDNKLMYCAKTCGEDSPIDRIWTHKDYPRPTKDNYKDFQERGEGV
jgi:MoaA/NifB/PqqE/SkfB family radical SAM enzyme